MRVNSGVSPRGRKVLSESFVPLRVLIPRLFPRKVLTVDVPATETFPREAEGNKKSCFLACVDTVVKSCLCGSVERSSDLSFALVGLCIIVKTS